MKCISWNYCGLGNPWTVKILNWIIKERCPHLVFFIETKCTNRKIESIRRALHYDYCFSVDSIGKSGGITMLWNQSTTIQVISYARWHISVKWNEMPRNQHVILTGFYGHPETVKRTCSWALLKHLKPLLAKWEVRSMAQAGDPIGKWKTFKRRLTSIHSKTYLIKVRSSHGLTIEVKAISAKRSLTEC